MALLTDRDERVAGFGLPTAVDGPACAFPVVFEGAEVFDIVRSFSWDFDVPDSRVGDGANMNFGGGGTYSKGRGTDRHKSQISYAFATSSNVGPPSKRREMRELRSSASIFGPAFHIAVSGLIHDESAGKSLPLK
jgi:hypothetical protein